MERLSGDTNRPEMAVVRDLLATCVRDGARPRSGAGTAAASGRGGGRRARLASSCRRGRLASSRRRSCLARSRRRGCLTRRRRRRCRRRRRRTRRDGRAATRRDGHPVARVRDVRGGNVAREPTRLPDVATHRQHAYRARNCERALVVRHLRAAGVVGAAHERWRAARREREAGTAGRDERVLDRRVEARVVVRLAHVPNHDAAERRELLAQARRHRRQ